MKQLLAEPADMMLLDLGLPDMDGGEVLKKVREWSEMPVIIVSARDQDREKAAVLDMGADDYLTKPFSATELLARIRVALRHLYRQGLPRPQSVYRVGGLELDVEKHTASLDGEPLHLTPMEFSLMSLLMKNAGKVLTSGYLLKAVSYTHLDVYKRQVMVTGDNPLTAAAIAAEAGVDDFLAEATPEGKLAMIRKLKAGGHMVAMTEMCIRDSARNAGHSI